MINAFAGFSQMAYVTTDLGQAIDRFAALGVPQWRNLGLVSMPLETGGEIRFRFALTYAGPLQLEIIEPAGGEDGVYRTMLPETGFGLAFHHVAFQVESPEKIDEIRQSLAAVGLQAASAGGDPGTAKFIYVDARDRLGHYLEYIYLTEERRARHRTLPRNP